MTKLSSMLILVSLLLLSLQQAPAETLISEPKKVTTTTRLRFFNHDVTGGDKPTVWVVAQTNFSDILPSGFGKVFVLDNLVTSEADPNSAVVGRLQGMAGLSDFRETSLAMLLNLKFTEGEYEGSTLSIIGRDPLGSPAREVPIVAGTGVFRMATGYAITSTYFSDPKQIHSIYEYNAVVVHHDPAHLFS